MIATPTTPPPQLPAPHAKFPELTMLTLSDVASIFDVTKRTVHRWIDAGDIPESGKVGGRRYWPYSQIKDWIDQGCPAQNNGYQARLRSASNGVNLQTKARPR